ncbi:MAG: N-acetyl-gamma-glutamyl-phosphate reductase, partial [Oscillospiraceae bacterium]|nr:N-acetyl-gamma-glutamyl-phosphate reductase [Oscillospiraceae bacterium]
MINVFIDGAEGTTGLRLESRLLGMDGVNLLRIEENLRKDTDRRGYYINKADVVFLCLPDAAAREAAGLAGDTVVIDASTAHRTAPGWAYGFPELSRAHYDAVRGGNRISVPGCYPTGFCGLIYPLVERGLIAPDADLSCFGLSGYSGGGKPLIERFEGGGADTWGARPYALGLRHKHLPEMRKVCGLEKLPVFMPVVAPIRQGMIVTV